MTIKSVEHFVEEYKKYGSIKKVAVAHPAESYETIRTKFYLLAVEQGLMDPLRVGGKSRDQLKNPPVKMEDNDPIIEGNVKAKRTPSLDLPPEGKVNRYIFTCAQSNTKIHEDFWENLQTFLGHLDLTSHKTQMFISKFTYIKNGLGSGADKGNITGRGRSELKGGVPLWFDPRIENYAFDDRLEIAPGLVWCGEMNIRPTAARPLSGMETYTARKSSLIPHVKVAMTSVASDMANDPTKFMYTTGTVTLRNYIQQKAGLKAEFHHCFAALLVEVDSAGGWWVRHLNADSDGTFYDLDTKVEHGVVTTGHRVEGITWGDPHVATMEPVAVTTAFGKGGIKDTLKPRMDFMGDVLDFRARAWQTVRDPHVMFTRYVQGNGDVRKEVLDVIEFLDRDVYREWCETYLVYGNHEEKMGRWLKDEDGRRDPVNAEFWFDLQRETYFQIRKEAEGREPNYLEVAIRLLHPRICEMFTFLGENEGHVICSDAAGGIQCGKHGHRGPRGMRGSPLAFAKMGRKTNLQHFHAAGIIDGIYVAGTMEHLNPDWTHGSPSDWSHSDIVTYRNGKRTILTHWKGKWKA